MTCCVCSKIILPTESQTSINDDHYHGPCFDRQMVKREKLDRVDRSPEREIVDGNTTTSEQLRIGDVVGRFRDGVLIDTGVVQDIIRTARSEMIFWTRGVKPQEGDGIRRILL